MEFQEKLKQILSIEPKENIPFKSSSGFLVENKKSLPFHLVIDEIKKREQEGQHSFVLMAQTVFENLDPSDQLNFSFALLDYYYFLKQNKTAHYSHYEILRVACSIFPEPKSRKIDQDFFTLFLEKINSFPIYIPFPGIHELLENLLHQSRSMKIINKLSEELKKLFGKINESKEEKQNQNYDERSYILAGKLTGNYTTIKAFQNELDANFATGKIEEYFPDSFPLTTDDPYYSFHSEVHKLIFSELPNRNYSIALKDIPIIKKHLDTDRKTQKDFLMALLYRCVWYALDAQSKYGLYQVANLFVRKKLPYTEGELIFVLNAFIHPKTNKLYSFQIGNFFKHVENHVKENGISDTLRETFKTVMEVNPRYEHDKQFFQKIKTRVQDLWNSFYSEGENILPFRLDKGDAFGKKVNQDLKKLEVEQQKKWYEILRLASSASAGKPSKKFISKTTPLIKDLGEKVFLEKINEWIQFLNKMEITRKSDWYGYFLNAQNIPVAKGLIWILSTLKTTNGDVDLEKLIVKCFKKIPGVGPASGALGNACIYNISSRNSLEGVALLNRVRSRIAQRNTKKLIEKYISSTAEALKISVADLEDFSIQDFGLTDGVREFQFNDYIGKLSLASFGKTKIEWIKPDGKLQKSVPSFVRKDFKEELKELRNTAKLIPKTLTIQRDRLDRSYIQKRVFQFDHFQKYYFQHGLMSFLTQKLIWTFEHKNQKTHAIYWNKKWQDVNKKEVNWIDENTTVKLWHPLECETNDILKWREFLLENQIKQPLKQAYREVYILTDAEVNTKSYSNRMAAHILKQHQFNALAGIRNWKYQLIGAYDDGLDMQACSLEIPDYNLRAEYWINELNAEDSFNDTGIWLYVATDQVRFLEGDNTVDLVDIPKIVFSEIMRDVDLFVGVASVGNDPAWQDNGGLVQYHNYWQSYSFGDLTELAKTRKTILERLVPRLKISKVSSIDGKFLIVKGKKRTYKIHIGSTNILMEPNDQYLCIVPGPNRDKNPDKLFIPFEGDRGLSILLSKAFLLAEDDKITDTTITRQINR